MYPTPPPVEMGTSQHVFLVKYSLVWGIMMFVRVDTCRDCVVMAVLAPITVEKIKEGFNGST